MTHSNHFQEAMELLERARTTYRHGKLAEDIAAFLARVQSGEDTRNAAEIVGSVVEERYRDKNSPPGQFPASKTPKQPRPKHFGLHDLPKGR